MEHVFALLDPPKPKPRSPSTVRPDFVMPTATCPSCSGELTAVAYYDLDSCGASLLCEHEGCWDAVGEDVPWPFVEDMAAPSDWEAAGIRVA